MLAKTRSKQLHSVVFLLLVEIVLSKHEPLKLVQTFTRAVAIAIAIAATTVTDIVIVNVNVNRCATQADAVQISPCRSVGKVANFAELVA